MALTENEYRRLLSITNLLIAQAEPSGLFTSIARELHSLYPIVNLGIAFYNRVTDHLERGLRLAADGTLQQVEAIPVKGSLIERAASARCAVLLSPEQIQESVRRFFSLGDDQTPAQSSGVILPLFNRAGRLLGIAAADCDASRPFTENDLPFLNQLAVLVGLALENTNLHHENALMRARLEQEEQYLKSEIDTAFDVGSLLFASKAIGDVMRLIEKAAATDATVLLTGETGTGKELFARTIHARSASGSRPLVKVNCGAIPAGLVESTLFGHEKGAFTGAVSRHTGVFEIADGGTLFLDEIGELPLEMQVKLLRVLQEGEFTRVGGREMLRVNVRIIAATNRVLEQMIEEGTFRSDLYYRLAVFPIAIPPLRERRDDIPLLATYFLQKYTKQFRRPAKRISSEAMGRLRTYAFLGNVRELENLIERAVVLSDGVTLGVELFPLTVPRHHPIPEAGGTSSTGSDTSSILRALESSNWIIEGPRGAAAKLKLKPSTLRSRMLKLGIRRS